MKLTSFYVSLALLLASTQAFQIFRSSNGLQEAQSSPVDSYPTMPCFAVVPQFYKAFSFWTDLADKPYTTEIAGYSTEEGVTAEFVWNMCSVVAYKDCSNFGPNDTTNNGYIKVKTVTKDEEG